jgi:predicted nucleotidyltransferase
LGSGVFGVRFQLNALPDTTLFDLGGLLDELEQLIGLRVDVITPRDLPAKFRHQILAEARPL